MLVMVPWLVMCWMLLAWWCMSLGRVPVACVMPAADVTAGRADGRHGGRYEVKGLVHRLRLRLQLDVGPTMPVCRRLPWLPLFARMLLADWTGMWLWSLSLAACLVLLCAVWPCLFWVLWDCGGWGHAWAAGQALIRITVELANLQQT